MAQDGARVSFHSGEMTVDRLLERCLVIEGRVRVDEVRKGALNVSGRASIGAAAVRLRDNAPSFAVIARGGVPALRDALCRGEELPSVVFVDSVSSLAEDGRVVDDALADAIRQLKALALELNVAVVVTSQVPGLAGIRRDRRPTIDDFGAIGAVKQHADVVLAIFREEMYDPNAGIEGATELLVRKNRNGATGYVDLYFYQKWMRFEDMLDPDR
jgi:replicative DNA helicase